MRRRALPGLPRDGAGTEGRQVLRPNRHAACAESALSDCRPVSLEAEATSDPAA